jgi:carbamate kinase
MRIVAALGGNALLERGDPPDADVQLRHAGVAAQALACISQEHELVVTHGNGPQVGVLALESEDDRSLSRPYPLDVIGAETQGMIGYAILQALENALPDRRFASLVCQTVVSRDDAAFSNPTKFVGRVYSEGEAERIARERGWQVRQDGDKWRRVVASPEPDEIVELPAIEALMGQGFTVICMGGGGVPVTRGADGILEGTEAVIDKDLAAALLARQVGADMLLLLTDVDCVQVDFGTPRARPIRETTAAGLRALRFPAGSMGPKVEAACRFVEATGGTAAIGRLQDAYLLANAKAGTVVRAGQGPKRPKRTPTPGRAHARPRLYQGVAR